MLNTGGLKFQDSTLELSEIRPTSQKTLGVEASKSIASASTAGFVPRTAKKKPPKPSIGVKKAIIKVPGAGTSIPTSVSGDIANDISPRGVGKDQDAFRAMLGGK